MIKKVRESLTIKNDSKSDDNDLSKHFVLIVASLIKSV